MKTIDPINLSIEFVKAQVDPGGGGSTGGSAVAQTGDFYVWAILAIVFVGIIAFCMFKLSRAYNNNSMRSASHASVSRNSLVSPNIILSSILMIVALIGLIVSLFASTSTAFANAQKNGIDFKPDKIQVVINEETGEVTCDPFEFVNNTADTYIFEKSELILSEDAKMVSTEEDWDLTLNAIGLNSYLFDGQPGIYNIDLDVIKPLNPGYTSAATLNFNKIDIDIAQKLIGKKVFTLTLTPYQNIVNIPEVSNFTFDNKPHTGVESGECYTLTGTSTATDAGTYNVTANLKAGMVWSDKTTEDKKFEWMIAPFNVVLEFDVGPEGYSVHYGDVWPASEEDVKIISKQELPEDFAKIFASGISISHSYEPVISQAGSQITVSIVKPETNKNYTTNYSDTAILNVLKRELKIDWDEDTCTVTYDGEVHWPDYELSGAYQEEKPQINLTAKNLTTGQTETPVAVGEYEITASLSDNPINRNYQLVSDVEHPITCVLTINEKPAASAYWKVEGTTLSLSPTKIEGYTKDEDILKGFSSPDDAPWHELLGSITKVEILEGEDNAILTPSKMTYLFAGLTKLESIDGLSYINTSTVKDMNHLFHDDQSIISLDLSTFNTSQATNMSALFQDTYKLESITLSSNFTTSLNSNFSSMFSDCGYSTTSGVTINNFKDSIKTTNAIDMSNMFFHANFATIDLSGFATSKVTNFSGMFQDFQLQDSTELDLTSFSNASATNLELMFADNEELTTIYANPATWVRSKTYSGSNTFKGCNNLVGTSKDRTYSLSHGQDTTYDSANYAYICESETLPGLLTDINVEEAKAFWGYNNNTKTLSLCSSYSDKTPKPHDDILNGFSSKSSIPWNYYFNEISSVEILQGENGKKLDFTSMENLFTGLSNCSNLTDLNSDTCNFENLLNMRNTFKDSAFTSLDLSQVDTSKVTTMRGIFDCCNKLENINLTGNFNTEIVANFTSAFKEVGSETTNGVEILFGEKCTTSNAENMTDMFNEAKFKDGIVDISTFSNSKVNSIYGMFRGCENLKTIYADPDKWTREHQYQKTDDTFKDCCSLVGTSKSGYTTIHGSGTTYDNSDYAYICESADFPGLFTTAVSAYWGLSDNNTTLYLCASPTENANTEDRHILYGFSIYQAPWSEAFESIKKVIIEAGDNDEQLKYINMYKLFANLSNCTEISGLQNINTSVVTNMSSLFLNCKNLRKLTFTESFNTKNVTDMSYLFSGCETLDSPDLSTFNTNNVKDMNHMFSSCKSISSLDLSSFDTYYVMNMSYMLNDCSNLSSIYVKDDYRFVTTNVTSDSNMFLNCNNLQGGAGTAYEESRIDSSYARIDLGDELETLGYFTDKSGYWKVSDNTLYLSPSSEEGYKEDDRIVCGFGNSSPPWFREFFTKVVVQKGSKQYILSPSSLYNWFKDKTNIISIDLNNLNTCRVRDMSQLFQNCHALQTISYGEKFNTSKVDDMSWMFYECRELVSLDLSKFDLSKTKNMASMFLRCDKLHTITFSQDCNTSEVRNMRYMFYECKALNWLNLSIFDTGNVTDMSSMFDGCTALTTLDLRTFDTKNVTNMSKMFNHCTALTTIYTSDAFVTTAVLPLLGQDMFLDCDALQGGSGTKYIDKKITDKSYARIDKGPDSDAPGYFTESSSSETAFWMVQEHGDSRVLHLSPERNSPEYKEDKRILTGFSETLHTQPWQSPETLTSIIIDEGYFGEKLSPKSTSFWFSTCYKVSSINLTNLNTSAVTSMRGFFDHCNALPEIIFPEGFNTSNVTDMSNMFFNCRALSSIDLKSFDTRNVTNMSAMFMDCHELTNLYNINKLDTSKVEYMACMFQRCYKLQELDLSTFDTSKVKSMGGMFHSCFVLNNLTWGDLFITNNVDDMGYMFYRCEKLESINLSTFDTSKVKSMDHMFSNCKSLKSIDLSNFNTSKVTVMNSMFSFCQEITSLDLSKFDTQNVNGSDSMNFMFYDCVKLKTIFVKDIFVIKNSVLGNSMFENCNLLEGGAGTKYSEAHVVDKSYARIDQPEIGKPGYFTEKAEY